MAVNFNTLIYYFQAYGVVDFLLPFLLVFTIVFAVSSRIDWLSENKNFRTVIAVVVGLLFVVPHVMLILLGLFGAEIREKGHTMIGIAAVAFVIYIFGASLKFWRGPYDIWGWWTSGTTELIIILLIFGLIVKFITGDDDYGLKKGSGESQADFDARLSAERTARRIEESEIMGRRGGRRKPRQ
jgi:hypothetical protein